MWGLRLDLRSSSSFNSLNAASLNSSELLVAFHKNTLIDRLKKFPFYASNRYVWREQRTQSLWKYSVGHSSIQVVLGLDEPKLSFKNRFLHHVVSKVVIDGRRKHRIEVERSSGLFETIRSFKSWEINVLDNWIGNLSIYLNNTTRFVKLFKTGSELRLTNRISVYKLWNYSWKEHCNLLELFIYIKNIYIYK